MRQTLTTPEYDYHNINAITELLSGVVANPDFMPVKCKHDERIFAV